jgi:hypothetical protein
MIPRVVGSWRFHLPGKHDQRTHGRAHAISGSGTREDPFVTGSVVFAAAALARGEYVQLRQKRQVSTLLDRLAAIAADARARGERAPTYDLCRVTLPRTNLFCVESKGIPRVRMPQLGGHPRPGSPADRLPRDPRDGGVDIGPLFIQSLRDRGIAVRRTTIDASYLRASQNELNGVKVAEISNLIEAGDRDPTPIYVTRDDYVLDGHHRWAASVAIDIQRGQDVDLPVYQIDLDILTALDLANQFSAEMGMPQVSVAAREAGCPACVTMGNRPARLVGSWRFHLPGKHDQRTHGNKRGGRLLRELQRRGGYTYRPLTPTPARGFMVSLPGAEERHPGIPSREAIDAYIERHRDRVERPGSNAFYGAWVDDTDGQVYLDISVHFDDRAAAEEFGRAGNQLAIRDLGAQESIRLAEFYDPSQPRHPAGSPRGGQFRSRGGGGSIEVRTGSGYGGRPMRPGEVIVNPNRRPGEPEFLVVEEAGERRVEADGMALGVGADSGTLYWARARPATPEEAAPLRARREQAERREQAQRRARAIAADIAARGERPPRQDSRPGGRDLWAHVWGSGGTYLPDVGGGEWLRDDGAHLWYIRGNGGDGDDWSLNNLPGAIGWRIPRDQALVDELTALGPLLEEPYGGA